MQKSPESDVAERSTGSLDANRTNSLLCRRCTTFTATRRSITSDLSRVWATGGIISAMPAVISSSRGAAEIAAGGRLPGLQTPWNIYIYSHYRAVVTPFETTTARKVARARTRFRYATPAERASRDKIIINNAYSTNRCEIRVLQSSGDKVVVSAHDGKRRYPSPRTCLFYSPHSRVRYCFEYLRPDYVFLWDTLAITTFCDYRIDCTRRALTTCPSLRAPSW